MTIDNNRLIDFVAHLNKEHSDVHDVSEDVSLLFQISLIDRFEEKVSI